MTGKISQTLQDPMEREWEREELILYRDEKDGKKWNMAEEMT